MASRPDVTIFCRAEDRTDIVTKFSPCISPSRSHKVSLAGLVRDASGILTRCAGFDAAARGHLIPGVRWPLTVDNLAGRLKSAQRGRE